MGRKILIKRETLVPQRGFQENFLSNRADVLIGGGQVGVGKSYAILLGAGRNTIATYRQRYIDPSRFNSMIFRRKATQINNEGGLWQTSENIYPLWNASPNSTLKRWTFPSGATVRFGHLIHENTKYDHKGGEYGMICFDELDLFTESQFWYLSSRNRSMSGVAPMIRATTNPQRSGWVKDMLQWYIYPDDYHIEALRGFVIPERAGKLRYMIRRDNRIHWGNSKIELYKKHRSYLEGMARTTNTNPLRLILSFSFVPGKLSDNKKLLQVNPQYQASLGALSEEERSRLLDGNWSYIADSKQLFGNYPALQNIFTNDFIAGNGQMYLTADIAGEGADLFVIGIWNGWRLIHIETMDKSNGRQVEALIKKMANKFHVPISNVCFDGDGMGHLLRGYLDHAIDFHGGKPPKPMIDTDIFGNIREKRHTRYFNLRSQCYFMLADMIEENKIYLHNVHPDHLKVIREELQAIHKVPIDESGRLRVEKKTDTAARLGHSPDFADMIMMRLLFPLLPKRTRKKGYYGTSRSNGSSGGSSVRRG